MLILGQALSALHHEEQVYKALDQATAAATAAVLALRSVSFLLCVSRVILNGIIRQIAQPLLIPGVWQTYGLNSQNEMTC